MAQSNTTASSDDGTNEDNRKGPFSIVPKYDCPHVSDRPYLLVQPASMDPLEQPPCTDCHKTEENWICLSENCDYVGCSRYHQKHMLGHYQQTGHNICFSLSDHSVFCYACDSYIDSPLLHGLGFKFYQKR